MKKFLNISSNSFLGGAVIIALTTILSKIIGLVRDKLLANFFGPGIILDSYFAAFRIPDFIFNSLVLGVLGVALIPMLTSLKDKEKHDQVVSNVMFVILMILTGLSIIGWVFAPNIVKIITTGFTDERLLLTISMTRIMLLSVTIFGVSNILGCVLQAKKIFSSVALAGVFYNLGIIGGIILGYYVNPIFLAWGVVFGSVLHLLTQLPNIINFKIVWHKFNQISSESIQVFKLMLPRIIGLISSQFSLTFVTAIITLMPLGSVTIYSLAVNIQSVPYSVVGVAIAVAAFPFMSESANIGKQFAQDHLNKLIKFQIILLLPVVTTIWIWRVDIVKILIGGGNFDAEATKLTADVLAILLFSVIPMALQQLSARTLYALKNTVTPTVISLGALVLVGVSSWYLKSYGLLAICFGLVAVDWFNAILMYISANKGNLHLWGINWPLKVLISVIVAFILQYYLHIWLKSDDYSIFMTLLIISISGIISVLVYGMALKLLKVNEFDKIISTFKLANRKLD